MIADRGVLLSVIIPCLNVARLLPNQLEALSKQQCSFDWELIIVDNGSTDDSIAVAESFRQVIPNLTIINETRKGRHYACNTGVKAARGEFVVFVDGDDQVGSGFLEAMVRALHSSPVAAGQLDHRLLNKNKDVTFGRVQADRLMDGFGFLPYASGASMGIHRTAFKAVGGFREMDYCEDADLSWRLQLAGYDIRFVNEAVLHFRQRPNRKLMFRQHRNYGEAHVLLYKHFKAHGMPRRSMRNFFREWLRLFASLLLVRSSDERTRWVRRFGRCLGHITGSVKYGVFYP